jgi:hypothetical protein
MERNWVMENKPFRISPVLVKRFATTMRKLGVEYFKCSEFEIKLLPKDPDDELIDVTDIVTKAVDQNKVDLSQIGGFPKPTSQSEEEIFVPFYRGPQSTVINGQTEKK